MSSAKILRTSKVGKEAGSELAFVATLPKITLMNIKTGECKNLVTIIPNWWFSNWNFSGKYYLLLSSPFEIESSYKKINLKARAWTSTLIFLKAYGDKKYGWCFPKNYWAKQVLKLDYSHVVTSHVKKNLISFKFYACSVF